MQALKNDIRKKILDAGRKEFSRKGFAKASMRSIAVQVGVGVGNLYIIISQARTVCSVQSSHLLPRHSMPCSTVITGIMRMRWI